MATKKFPSELTARGTVLTTDKLLIHNITTGETCYTTVAELLAALSIFAAGQIGFPATQVPSANVNTLDDYQEGTWTPSITFGGAASGITYGANNAGAYTKIGNIVTISGYFELTSKGVSTGDAIIGGLPFIVENQIRSRSAVSLYLLNISFADFPMAYTVINTQTIELSEITNAGVKTSLVDTNFANNSVIILNSTYRVE